MFGARTRQSEQTGRTNALLALRRPQAAYDQIAQKRFRRPDSFFDNFYSEHMRRPDSFYDTRIERYLLSLTPEVKVAGAVSRIEDMLQNVSLPLPLTNQARAFVMVPQVNDLLEKEGMVTGVTSGIKRNGELYILGLIFDGPDIIAYDAILENGTIKTYKTKTANEMRAKLTQVFGGSWNDPCVPRAPQLSFGPQQSVSEIPKGLREQFLAERMMGAPRPASLREQYLTELVARRPEPASLLGQYLAERASARVAAQKSLWPERNADLTGLPNILELASDTPSLHDVHATTREQVFGVTIEPVDAHEAGSEIKIPFDRIVVREDARWPALGEEYGAIAAAEAQAHAAPAPMPPVPPEAAAPEKHEERKIDAAGSVITRSELDSDLVEKLISAGTVHIGTLNIHVHKGRVPRNSDGEEE